MELDPQQMAPADRYKLLIGAVVPRPIAFVSTLSPDGRPNLAPYSFFNAVGASPMTLMFCPANNLDGSEKDTLRNSAPTEEGGTGEFVVNVASDRYERAVAGAGEALAYGESEFDLVGLEEAPSTVVKAPRVAASPVAFECRTLQITRLNPGAPGGANLVLGEIVRVHIDDGLLNDRMHVDADALGAIGRLGGFDYCRTSGRFGMPAGRAALEQN